jgi:mRNA-degrading endonuclease RelE of RelBE toxin-antitoxin system
MALPNEYVEIYTALPYYAGMTTNLVTLVEFPEFQKKAASLLSEKELLELKTFLASNPESGDLIQGTGGVRKLRWASQGQGKRGGNRIIYYFQDLRFPIFLLTLFAKNLKADLTQAHRNELRTLIESIKQSRRKK